MSELPKIVIEIGINHNGDIDLAKKMIDQSWRSLQTGGYACDNVYWKLQKRTPELAVPEHMKDTPRKSLVTGEMTTYLQYKEEIEFDFDDYLELFHYARKAAGWTNTLFASVWDEESVRFVEWLQTNTLGNVPYIKIPSARLTNSRLIRVAVETGIPLILSTGMSTRIELFRALVDVPADYPLTIMSCTASYPCIDDEANLRKIRTLQSLYGHRAKIGFSSHSPSPMVPIYSNFFDVDMIEVHYTLDRTMEGSDHAASLESKAIELLARETVRIPKLYGSGAIEVLPSEMEKKRSLRG